MKKIHLLIIFFLMFFSYLSSPTAAQDQSESIIKYRKSVMKAVGGHMSALFSVVQGGLTEFHDLLVPNAHAIHESAKNLVRMFPKGTHSGRTRAKPEIWSEWEQFNKAALEMEQTSAKLVSLVEAGKFNEFDKNLRHLSQSCKGCHKIFRARR